MIIIFFAFSYKSGFPNTEVSSATARASSDLFISEFSRNILLSTNDEIYNHHVEPTLAISENDTIFVGWKNSETHNGGGARVSFTRSSDLGVSWTDPIDMPMFKGETRQSDPWLVWHEGTLFYAYLEFSVYSTLSQITVAKSSDHSGTWTKVSATNAEGFADKETLTVSNDGIVYVTYDDIILDDVDETKVRLSRSKDGGNTFKEISVITDSITHREDHVGPYVVTDSNNDVYVSWFWLTDDFLGDVYLTASKDQGETFSQAIDINLGSENCSFVEVGGRPSRVTLPVIRFDQYNRLYALWAEQYEPNGTWDVYLKYSDHYGLNWSTRYQVNPFTKGNQWLPDMDIDSKGRIHVVYYDEQGSNYRPYYRMITFLDETREEMNFSDPVAIATLSTFSSFTRPGDYFTVRVDSNDIPHVVWTDGRNHEMDIYYSYGLLGQPSTTTTTPSYQTTIFPTSTIPSSSHTTLNDTFTDTTTRTSSWAMNPIMLVLLGFFYYRRKKSRKNKKNL
ncbi:MAG: sialidase family protein [Candidatus Hodarchaeales archaeon]